MRLVSFKKADGLRIGVITDKGVVDLTLIDPLAPTDLSAVVKEGKIDNILLLPLLLYVIPKDKKKK